MGKTKKGKKGKKQKGFADAEQEIPTLPDIVQEAPTQASVHGMEALSQPMESPRGLTAQSEDAGVEDFEQASRTKGKKGKKDKKRKGTQEMEPKVPIQPSDATHEAPSQPRDTEMEGFEEGFTSTGNKGKTDKKKRASAAVGADDFIHPLDDGQADPIEPLEARQEETAQPLAATEGAPMQPPNDAQEAPSQPKDDDIEDFKPAPKKGKKAKKDKKKATADAAQENVTDPLDAGEDNFIQPLDLGQEGATDPLDTARDAPIQPDDMEGRPLQTQEDDVEGFERNSKQKGKKGKKQKASADSGLDYFTAPINAGPDDVVQTVHTAPEAPSQPEDDGIPELEPASKQKGKKGKKRIAKQSTDWQNEPSEPPSRSISLKDTAKTAGTVGAGVAIFEGLQRAASMSDEQDDQKKVRKDGRDAAMAQHADPLEYAAGEPSSVDRHPKDQGFLLSDDHDHVDRGDSALLMQEATRSREPSPNHSSVRDSGNQDTRMGPVLVEESRQQKRETSEDQPLQVSVEASPEYDVSVSSPRGVHLQREVSERPDELPAHSFGHVQGYPSPARSDIDRDPSPVDSMSKDRSAALFGSSPSTRNRPVVEEALLAPEEPPSPSPKGRDSGEPIEVQQSSGSLFGGPVGYNSDRDAIRSPPQTPMPYGSAGTPLATIAEQSPDDTPARRKAREAAREAARAEEASSDVAKRRRSRRRAQSPQADGARQLGLISTDDLISRLSWPEVDEETQSVDLERSRSRNTDIDRGASLQRRKKLPLVTDPDRAEGERRSASGASIKSQESINAIIRSPKLRSTDTPSPQLRRASRSISSDLRGASKRSEATSEPGSAESDAKRSHDTRPKKASADDVDRNLPAIASSSTYDPVTDKGKGPITKMADVYVSLTYRVQQ